MKRKSMWFYYSIVAMAVGLGVTVYSLVTGEILMLGKFLIVLAIGVYCFIRERGKMAQQKTARDQEEQKPLESQSTKP